MNKKFTTLAAGLLLAGAFVVSGNAQVLTPTGKIAYRAANNGASTTYTPVLAAALDSVAQNVYAIDGNRWYQLVVTDASTKTTYALAQVRDLGTGVLKLQMAPLPAIGNAGTVGVNPSLNNSLWKIVTTAKGTRGWEYTFQNKETGYYLAYNINDVKTVSALTDIATGAVYSAYKNVEVDNALDQSKWLWYSDTNNGDVAFGAQKIYAYTHTNTDKVMGLAVKEALSSSKAVDVVPVMVPSSAANQMDNVNFLNFTIVNAGVMVLNANEINGMINADEQLSSNKVLFKATPAVSNALFSGKYTAADVTGKRGYDITLSPADGKLLTVQTDSTYETGKNPTEHGGLIVSNVTASVVAPIDATEARSVWKVTYWPTQDSVVLEPYNASIIGTRDAQKGNKWAATPLKNATAALFYNTINAGIAHTGGSLASDSTNVPFAKLPYIPVALTVMNIGSASYDNGLVLTVGQPDNDAIGDSINPSYKKPGNPVIAYVRVSDTDATATFPIEFADMGFRIQFNNTYSYMTRVNVASGLYFIKLYDPNASSDVRTNGAYVVDNMAGWMMYDKPAMDQNFNIMPATMWVVDQYPCYDAATPAITIANREYGRYNPKTGAKDAIPYYYAFQGQLYQVYNASTGKPISNVYRTINATYPTISTVDKYGKFDQTVGIVDGVNNIPLNQKLHSDEAYTFVAVTDTIAKTPFHGYKAFSTDELTNGVENNYYLRYSYFDNDALYLASPTNKLAVTSDADSTLYEIGEAVIPGTTTGAIQDPNFGYNGEAKGANLQKINRFAYVIKVKDANLIDNDSIYVAYAKNPTATDEMWYYTAMKYKDISAGMNKGTAKWADFYLKADQLYNGKDTSYVLVDLINPVAPTKAIRNNGWAKANVVDGLGHMRYSDLNENPADRSSAFYTEWQAVKQYIDVTSSKYAFPKAGGLVKIYREAGNANEYLFEDQNDQSGVVATTGQAIKSGLGYLAIESKGISYNAHKGHAAMYLDPVYNGIGASMPTYLLLVNADVIPSGYVCETQVHGYWNTAAEAEKADETHYVPYMGYTAGRYLVNLQDSIDANSYMLEKANKFKFQNYTRLAFLEGIHQVDTTAGKDIYGTANEYLYLIKDGYSLTDFYNVKNNSKSMESAYVPGYVLNQYTGSKAKSFIDYKTKAFSANKLVRGINSKVTWSLRKTNDNASYTASASEPFLMENCDGTHTAPGLFEGAWVKVQNGIPVIAQINNAEGTHEGTTSSLLNEVVNQAQIFHFATTDETATSAQAVSVSNVGVLAGEGTVQILNAAGKKVVVTNILGQTVANEVISSDNATISAPAGVVVVAIEGSKAVKAIVK